MKVSVLVPVYGVESYIAKCATTLMEQTYKDVEYIFVDDCTPDASVERLREVVAHYPERQPQVRIISHERNMGSGAVRQTALDAATGEAVIFVDSDDYVDPHMIECLVEQMQRSGASLVDGGYATVTRGEVARVHLPLRVSDKGYLKIILCQNVDSNRIWGRLIKKSLFTDNDIRFVEGIDYGEDFSVLPRLLISARRSTVDSCVYFYRNDNPQSYTNNITTQNAMSFFKAQELIGTFMTSHEQWKQFSFAMQTGWVNVWRFARRFNVPRQQAEGLFTQRSTHVVARSLEWMFRCGKMPYKAVNFIYLATRRIYLTFAGR